VVRHRPGTPAADAARRAVDAVTETAPDAEDADR
jgi:hypothetical protein